MELNKLIQGFILSYQKYFHHILHRKTSPYQLFQKECGFLTNFG